MYAANISNNMFTIYASCVIVELYKTDKGDLLVELYYRNQTDKDPFPLTVPGCATFSCPLQVFENVMKPMAVYTKEEWHNICGIAPPTCIKEEKDLKQNNAGTCTSIYGWKIYTYNLNLLVMLRFLSAYVFRTT